jgi:hypothetical protein
VLEYLEQVFVLKELLLTLCLILTSFNRCGLNPILEPSLHFLAFELNLNNVDEILGSLLKKHVIVTFPSLLHVPVSSQNTEL